MKIISNKRYEEFKELEETNRKLGNQIMMDAENIKRSGKEISDLKKGIEEMNRLIADLDSDRSKYLLETRNKEKQVKQLEKQLEIANKEIEDLKKNVRKAHSKVTEEQVQAVTNAIVDEAKTNKKSVKKVVDEIVEESKEKTTKIKPIKKKIEVTKINDTKRKYIGGVKLEELKKRGRKPKNAK